MSTPPGASRPSGKPRVCDDCKKEKPKCKVTRDKNGTEYVLWLCKNCGGERQELYARMGMCVLPRCASLRLLLIRRHAARFARRHAVAQRRVCARRIAAATTRTSAGRTTFITVSSTCSGVSISVDCFFLSCLLANFFRALVSFVLYCMESCRLAHVCVCGNLLSIIWCNYENEIVWQWQWRRYAAGGVVWRAARFALVDDLIARTVAQPRVGDGRHISGNTDFDAQIVGTGRRRRRRRQAGQAETRAASQRAALCQVCSARCLLCSPPAIVKRCVCVCAIY
jgi:hypothetical protein